LNTNPTAEEKGTPTATQMAVLQETAGSLEQVQLLTLPEKSIHINATFANISNGDILCAFMEFERVHGLVRNAPRSKTPFNDQIRSYNIPGKIYRIGSLPITSIDEN